MIRRLIARLRRRRDDAEPYGSDADLRERIQNLQDDIETIRARHGIAPDIRLTKDDRDQAGLIELHLMCDADLRGRLDRLAREMT